MKKVHYIATPTDVLNIAPQSMYTLVYLLKFRLWVCFEELLQRFFINQFVPTVRSNFDRDRKYICSKVKIVHHFF